MSTQNIEVPAMSNQDNLFGFTDRETACLTQAIGGKNLLEIAEHLKISKRTVYFYLSNAKVKLEALAKQVFKK